MLIGGNFTTETACTINLRHQKIMRVSVDNRETWVLRLLNWVAVSNKDI